VRREEQDLRPWGSRLQEWGGLEAHHVAVDEVVEDDQVEVVHALHELERHAGARRLGVDPQPLLEAQREPDQPAHVPVVLHHHEHLHAVSAIGIV
jgi:hypothetical protein